MRFISRRILNVSVVSSISHFGPVQTLGLNGVAHNALTRCRGGATKASRRAHRKAQTQKTETGCKIIESVPTYAQQRQPE